MVIVIAVVMLSVVVAVTVWASFGVEPDLWENPDRENRIRREEISDDLVAPWGIEYRPGEKPRFVADVKPGASPGPPGQRQETRGKPRATQQEDVKPEAEILGHSNRALYRGGRKC